MNAQLQPMAEIPAKDMETIAKAKAWSGELSAVRVTDDETYDMAAGLLKNIKGGLKKLEDNRRMLVDPLNAHVKKINDLFREPVDKLKQSESHLKREMGAHIDKKEAEQRRLQAELEEKARKERERLEARAEKAAAKGQEEKAEALVAQADMTTAPVVHNAPPKVAGVSNSFTYSAECVDVVALCAAIAAGTVPPIAVEPSSKFLNAQAKALKEHFAIPGCQLQKKRTIRSGAA